MVYILLYLLSDFVSLIFGVKSGLVRHLFIYSNSVRNQQNHTSHKEEKNNKEIISSSVLKASIAS